MPCNSRHQLRRAFSTTRRGSCDAGSGAILGLDGVTIEMDAAVMDTRGALGSAACLQRVKNPVLVARDVATSASS